MDFRGVLSGVSVGFGRVSAGVSVGFPRGFRGGFRGVPGVSARFPQEIRKFADFHQHSKTMQNVTLFAHFGPMTPYRPGVSIRNRIQIL